MGVKKQIFGAQLWSLEQKKKKIEDIPDITFLGNFTHFHQQISRRGEIKHVGLWLGTELLSLTMKCSFPKQLQEFKFNFADEEKKKQWFITDQ